ncbi:hypothetical protein ANO11243_066050 [Dothideomycetidae sp. 11243]|nr:hypothetical protein ANO11243_066050 [fungal sp. No.11243]
MQTVWSRVAQARVACHCASCNVKTSITRHSGTAAGKRPTRYLTSSTLLYSGIFAVAATTDALLKEKRRRDWDDAIAHAKEGVEQVQVRLEGLEGMQILKENDLRQGARLGQDDFLDDADAVYQEPSNIAYRSIWPESSGNTFDQTNFPPQSIWASPRYQAQGRTRAWTPKKLHLTELAMDKLTLRVLLRLDEQDWAWDGYLDSFSDRFKDLIGQPRSRLQELLCRVDRSIKATLPLDAHADQSVFAQSPGLLAHYSQDVNCNHLETITAVEQSIVNSFRAHASGELSKSQLVLSTLHSLLTSPAPPSLAALNHVVSGFSRRGVDPNITNLVIRAMRASHVRMNELSLVSILEHFIRTNDYNRFCRYVELMQGMHGGLGLARPDIMITEKSQNRLVFVENHGQKKIVQKPVANPVVFNTLIQGVLHFDGFEAALDICKSMGQDGWGLSMKGLTPLLRDCARRANWNAGLAVWKQIKRVQALSTRNGHAESIQSWTYATMLRLCVACEQKVDFGRILTEAVNRACLSRNALLKQVKQLNLAQESVLSSDNEGMLVKRASSSKQPRRASQPLRWLSAQDTVSATYLTSSGAGHRTREGDAAVLEDSTILRLRESREEGISEKPSFQDSMSTAYENQAEALATSVAREDSSVSDQSTAQSQPHRQTQDRITRQHRSPKSVHYRAPDRRRISVQRDIGHDQLLDFGEPSRSLDEWELVERPMALMSASEAQLSL